ncbi:HAD-IIB family hydrolase [Candidatus Saccharibacteria bacterium]|nr:HAD-IIB family hydrolase [Candidatus Saccharibacteria bacterium]
MPKYLIAFDLDGTLAESKSPIEDIMSTLLGELLEKYQVCVISGGKYEQFMTQLIDNLHVDRALLSRLHIMPTCGTRYMVYDPGGDSWAQVYAEDIPAVDKHRIIEIVNEGVDKLGYREKKTYGDTIEDRGSQITFSALGQDIVETLGEDGVKLKKEWDPRSEKKQKLRDYIADRLSDYEVRVGGATSVDITRPGIDKAYGMRKIEQALGLLDDDILFIGDALFEGGNDYPVRAMGIDTVAVSGWQETAVAIETIIKMS